MDEKILHFFQNTVLFYGMHAEETATVLERLGTRQRSYARREVIFRAGTCPDAIALVLSGSVCIEHDDAWGNKSVLDRVGPGQVFAESYACAPGEPMPVSAVAAEKSEVAFLHTRVLLQSAPEAATEKLIRNLLRISVQKNLNLSRKIFYTSSKSIRGRLQSYLSDQVTRRGARTFDIPFDRQQLADYLGVDRSALSNELSKMQREGMLTVHKNHFCILALEEQQIV